MQAGETITVQGHSGTVLNPMTGAGSGSGTAWGGEKGKGYITLSIFAGGETFHSRSESIWPRMWGPNSIQSDSHSSEA